MTFTELRRQILMYENYQWANCHVRTTAPHVDMTMVVMMDEDGDYREVTSMMQDGPRLVLNVGQKVGVPQP